MKERLGRPVTELQSGLHVVIPFIDLVIRVDKGSTALNFKTEMAKVAVDFSVFDATAMRSNVADLNSAIKVAADSVLKRHLEATTSPSTTAPSTLDLQGVHEKVFADMVDLFKVWGVKIEKVSLAKL